MFIIYTTFAKSRHKKISMKVANIYIKKDKNNKLICYIFKLKNNPSDCGADIERNSNKRTYVKLY